MDGGNTKTIAVVATSDGDVLGVGRGRASDIYGTGSVEKGTDELARTVEQALEAASVDGAGLDAAVFSLAGADWPEDIELLDAFVRGRFGLADAVVANDAIGGLRTGAPDWEGIAVVVGTANAIGARNRDGRVFHLGFWPDRTGAFDLSVAALNAVYRDGLDLGPRTDLTERVLDLYGATDAVDLMHRFTRRQPEVRLDLFKLCPLLLDVAEAADDVARAIVVDAGRVLGDQARVAAERVGLAVEGTPVVLSGGVLTHPSDLLAGAIMERLPGAVAVRPSVPPIVGAVLLALDAVGATADAGALAAAIDSRGHD